MVGHLPDARGAWRRGRFGRALERRLERAGTRDAGLWAAAAQEASVAVAEDGRPKPVLVVVQEWCERRAEALGVHEHAGVRWLRAEGLSALAEVALLLGRWRLATGGNASAWRAWRRSMEGSARAAGYDAGAWCAEARLRTGASGAEQTDAQGVEAAASGAKGAKAKGAKAKGAKAKGAKAKGAMTKGAKAEGKKAKGAKSEGATGSQETDRRAARERAAADDARAKHARGTTKKTKRAPKG